jgi:ArsR family transcriptional regulator
MTAPPENLAMLHSMRQFKAEVFRALAHPTRVAIVEQLRRGERSVGELCQQLGLEQANASQHLAVLRGKYLVQTRKDGNLTFYRLRDPLLGDVLEALRLYFQAHLQEALGILREESPPRQRKTRKATRHR